MLTVAVLAASILVPALPPIGLPLVALPLAWLCYSGATWLALGASVAGAALVWALDPVYGGLTLVLMLAAGPLAAKLLRSMRLWKVVALLAVIAFVTIVGTEAVRSSADGSDLATDMRKQVTVVADAWAVALEDSLPEGTADEGAVAELRAEAVRLGMLTWPSTYALIAGLAALLAARAVAHAARKLHALPRPVEPLARLDLSWHVVWGVIAALGLLAAARGMKAPDGVASMLGVNLLIVSASLLFAQGLGVAVGLYRKLETMENSGSLRVTLVAGMLATIVLGAPVLFGSLAVVGLADLWANFRGLPRDGKERPPSSLEPMSRHGLD